MEVWARRHDHRRSVGQIRRRRCLVQAVRDGDGGELRYLDLFLARPKMNVAPVDTPGFIPRGCPRRHAVFVQVLFLLAGGGLLLAGEALAAPDADSKPDDPETEIQRANDKGSVWIWQRAGRPQAVMELYRGSDSRSWVHVIHSLSPDALEGDF